MFARSVNMFLRILFAEFWKTTDSYGKIKKIVKSILKDNKFKFLPSWSPLPRVRVANGGEG